MTPGQHEQNEQERRAQAEQNKGRVVAGSGEPLEGRKLDQMVSLRLDPEVLTALRALASKQRRSVSDLLRQAAIRLILESQTKTMSFEILEIVTGLTTERATIQGAAAQQIQAYLFGLTASDLVDTREREPYGSSSEVTVYDNAAEAS